MPQAPEQIVSKDPAVRLQILEVVAKLPRPMAIEKIIPFLLDEEDSVRGAAERALTQIDPEWEKSEPAKKTIPVLQRATHQDNYWIGLAAVETLKRIQGEDAPSSTSTQAKVERTTVTDHFFHQRREAARILASALKDSDPDLRMAAAEVLGKMGDVGFNDALAIALSDKDEWVRWYAALSLNASHWQAPDDKQRAAYVVALRSWDEAATLGEPAVDPLLAALNNPDSKIREGAATALGKLKTAKAESPLAACLQDKHKAVRRAAARAISQIGPKNLTMEQRNLLVEELKG